MHILMNNLAMCRRNDGGEESIKKESPCEMVKGKYFEIRPHIYQNWAAVLYEGGHSCTRICWSVVWTSGLNTCWPYDSCTYYTIVWLCTSLLLTLSFFSIWVHVVYSEAYVLFYFKLVRIILKVWTQIDNY